jgi:transposase-like protein
MTTRKRYTAAEKAELVLELLKEEQTLSELASDAGIHPNQLRNWRNTVLEGLPRLFERDTQTQAAEQRAHEAQIEALYTEIGKLSTQLAWLQKKSGRVG